LGIRFGFCYVYLLCKSMDKSFTACAIFTNLMYQIYNLWH